MNFGRTNAERTSNDGESLHKGRIQSRKSKQDEDIFITTRTNAVFVLLFVLNVLGECLALLQYKTIG